MSSVAAKWDNPEQLLSRAQIGVTDISDSEPACQLPPTLPPLMQARIDPESCHPLRGSGWFELGHSRRLRTQSQASGFG